MTSLASRTLMTVGAVLILTSLLDYLVLLVPPQFDQLQWKLGLAGQLVDRGIVPLVGITFLLVGSWITEQSDSRAGSNLGAVRLVSLGLASLLGLMFLLVVPFHLSNASAAQKAQLEELDKQATEADKNLPTVVANQVQQEKGRIQALLQNEAVLNQAIASGQVKEDQVTLLQQFKDKPASIDSYLNEKAKEEEGRLKTEIQTRKADAISNAKTGALKSSLRTGLSSLLLAIAYAVVGWTGLRAAK